jgi:hypothetical protein
MRRTASVIADVPSTVAIISGPQLTEISDEHPFDLA